MSYLKDIVKLSGSGKADEIETNQSVHFALAPVGLLE